MSKTQTTADSDQDGQVAFEYVMGITLALVVISALLFGVRRPIQAVWKHWVERISAPCPHSGCNPPP